MLFVIIAQELYSLSNFDKKYVMPKHSYNYTIKVRNTVSQMI